MLLSLQKHFVLLEIGEFVEFCLTVFVYLHVLSSTTGSGFFLSFFSFLAHI